ncbi:MAG: hypothetical protein GPJ52_11860 [Candidatus Heimdallarchaeota archaeon]|nr:hypothetical protein [Candidatus Heimdallarchaeota archaeon]
MTYYGIKKTFDADVELEIVGRYHKDNQSLLVFLINRGKKKEGTFKILIPAKTRLPKNEPLNVEVLYTYNKSGINLQETTLEEMKRKGLNFSIMKDDCIVLRFSPKNQKKKSKK